jgi:hypothetical protein
LTDRRPRFDGWLAFVIAVAIACALSLAFGLGFSARN